MGVVYLAHHDEGGPAVALKTVRVHQRRNLVGIRAEIKALASLRHPGIVRILDFGVEGGAPWYAMELLQGQNLGQFVANAWLPAGVRSSSELTTADTDTFTAESGTAAPVTAREFRRGPVAASSRLPAAGGHLTEILRIMRDLCRALSYLHRNGLLHGDLKPSNVFLCDDGRVVLLDFGLVARSRGTIGRESPESVGGIRGTISYLAPERLRGDFADARADLFALGVMFYEALTGKLPFRGANAAEILEAQQAGVAMRPSRLADNIPAAIDQVVDELLAFAARDRLGHAEDVTGVLESLGVSRGSPIDVSGPGTTYLYRPPLAGRGKALELLLNRLARMIDGQGGIVLLTGESGAGKTALMAELGRLSAQRRVVVVSGECIPMGAGGGNASEIKEAPLHPFRTLLQDIADRSGEWDSKTVEALLATRAKLLARYEPALASVPGIEHFPDPPELPAEAAVPRLTRELGGLLGALPSVEGPLLLLIDDLQWADEVSVRFLESLSAEFFRGKSVLIVATIRTEEMGSALRALAERAHVESVSVERLDEAGVESIVGGMLAMSRPPFGLVRYLSQQSEGNPFFVAEYLRLAVGEGYIVRQGGRWQVAKAEANRGESFESLSLPGSVRDLVARRLRGLSAHGREAVDIAAVIGRTFGIALLAHLLEVDEDEAAARLLEPISLNIIQDTSAGTYRFAHDKLREASYAEFPPDRKRDAHARVARAIQARYRDDRSALLEHAAELVYHFKLGEDPASALEYLELAGEVALEKSAHQQAASFLEEAVSTAARERLEVSRDRLGRWERMIGDAYLALGDLTKSLGHFQVALKALGDPAPAGGSALAGSVLRQIILQVSHRTGLRSIPQAPHGETAKLLEKMQIHDRLLQISYYTGAALPSMMHAMVCSLNLAELAGPSPFLALGYVNAAATCGILPIRKLADHYFALARATLEKHPHAEIETFVGLLEAHYRFGCGAMQSARSLVLRGMEISERLGFIRRWEETAGLYCTLMAAEGQFEDARQLSNKILVSAERGDRQTRCWHLTGRAQALLDLDDAQSALHDARLAAELAAGQLRHERLRATGVLALALLRCGELDEAIRMGDATMTEIKAGPPVAPYWLDHYCGVLDVRFAAWDRDKSGAAARAARASLRALRRLAHVFPYASSRFQLYRGKFLWREGRRRAALAAWSRGIQLGAEGGLHYDQGLNEVAFGSSSPESQAKNRQVFDTGLERLQTIGARYAVRVAGHS